MFRDLDGTEANSARGFLAVKSAEKLNGWGRSAFLVTGPTRLVIIHSASASITPHTSKGVVLNEASRPTDHVS